VTLEEKRALSQALLSCGASIGEINCVRKHLSRIKGGRLAMASPAPVFTLAISDIPGNEASLIASGPTAQDHSTLEDARAVLARYAIEPAPGIGRALRDPANETPVLACGEKQNTLRIVASGMTALKAAARYCREHGIEPLVLGDAVEGEASSLACDHARQAAQGAAAGTAVCLLSGGETTVSLGDSPGLGGRNTEYALALALALAGRGSIWGLAADTDGIDGIGGHCGAMIDPSLLERARAAGLDAADYLRRHDSATFFRLAGGLMTGGPTGTNVNDFRAILVNP
jgi:hydroxypyruvate reductase